jgi:CTD nuclear envelope phosphatase 1
MQHQSVTYNICPLSPASIYRLGVVQKKILVLDLDETLIHSHHDGLVRPTVKPGTPPDFILRVLTQIASPTYKINRFKLYIKTLKVEIERHPVRFYVYKRPHVDYFLKVVSQWYDLVVFTASMEIYGAAVADKLDNNTGILSRRYYRQVKSLTILQVFFKIIFIRN